MDTYDLVIAGGRVMDPETMYDTIANVGIKGDRIAVITTEKITGKKTIDARGHVVAPGFIDTQYHGLPPFGITQTPTEAPLGFDEVFTNAFLTDAAAAHCARQ